MKDKMERRGERKRGEDIMENRDSMYKSIEVWNKTICIISSFTMAREEKVTRGSGIRQDERVWLEHDITGI